MYTGMPYRQSPGVTGSRKPSHQVYTLHASSHNYPRGSAASPQQVAHMPLNLQTPSAPMSRAQPVAAGRQPAVNEAAYFIQRVNNILQNQLTAQPNPSMPQSATAKQKKDAPEFAREYAKKNFGAGPPQNA